jgi:hypothetical protein
MIDGAHMFPKLHSLIGYQFAVFTLVVTKAPSRHARRVTSQPAVRIVETTYRRGRKRLRELYWGGVCPSNAILLRQTICLHLRRSRPQEIFDVFQRIRLRFLGACGLASASSSLCLATKDYLDRLLAGFIALSQGLYYNARHHQQES